MTTLEQAARQALETLERASDAGYSVECDETITALREALEKAAPKAAPAPQQEAQEPVALLVRKNSWRAGQWEAAPPDSPHYGLTWANQRKYVYAAPQQAPAPLSDDVSQKTWALIDELEKLRRANRDEEDWYTLNKRDDELRAALASQGYTP